MCLVNWVHLVLFCVICLPRKCRKTSSITVRQCCKMWYFLREIMHWFLTILEKNWKKVLLGLSRKWLFDICEVGSEALIDWNSEIESEVLKKRQKAVTWWWTRQQGYASCFPNQEIWQCPQYCYSEHQWRCSFRGSLPSRWKRRTLLYTHFVSFPYESYET